MSKIVYILTNEAMPGLVKIGSTANTIAQRLRDLSGATGVPLPFSCVYAMKVGDEGNIEKHLHDAFAESRVHPRREFFRIDPDRVWAALRISGGEDVTPHDEVLPDVEDRAAIQRAVGMRPPFRFSLAKIIPGSELVFSRADEITAEVVSDKKIRLKNVPDNFPLAKQLGDEIITVTRSAAAIMQDLGYEWSAYTGAALWKYDGETLNERRDRIEQEQNDDE